MTGSEPDNNIRTNCNMYANQNSQLIDEILSNHKFLYNVETQKIYLMEKITHSVD